MRLKLIDYDATQMAFDEKFKETTKLINEGETHLDNLAEGFHEADGVIWSMPTIDAVPVVRCADCKHWQRHTQTSLDYGSCRKYRSTMRFDDFCSCGERKTDDFAARTPIRTNSVHSPGGGTTPCKSMLEMMGCPGDGDCANVEQLYDAFLPADDVAQMIHCRDCKHSEKVGNVRWCKSWRGYNNMGDDGFCNYGQREAKQ